MQHVRKALFLIAIPTVAILTHMGFVAIEKRGCKKASEAFIELYQPTVFQVLQINGTLDKVTDEVCETIL